MKFKILIFLLAVGYISSCSTWNHDEIGHGPDGNFWIKEVIPSCSAWQSSYKKLIPEANILYMKSKESSLKCLITGPNDESVHNENQAVTVYKLYLEIISDKSFTTQAFNKCFGSENFYFFKSTAMDSIRAYVYSMYHCSKDMAEKFKNAESSSQYLKEFESYLQNYNEKFKDISGKN